MRVLTLEEALTPPSGRIAPGWPVSTGARIQASAVAAQLDGKGPLEIVVAAIGDAKDADIYGKSGAAKLWAWDNKGMPLGDWPVDVQSATERAGDGTNFWISSPSVADLDGDKFDEIAVPMPQGNQNERGFSLFWGDGTRWPTTFGRWDRPDAWSNMPLVDVTGDGTVDLISGGLMMTPTGKTPRGWSSKNQVGSGYGICWADMDGDGKLEGFMPHMEKNWWMSDKPETQIMVGLNNAGEPLKGWPQPINSISIFAAVGDIVGDDNMEIVTIDLGGTLRAWTLDGQGVPGSKTGTNSQGQTTRGAIRTGMSGTSPIALADLDGDGKAEIIATSQSGELLTLKADGSNWGSGRLGRADNFAGVAVADLSGDGEMDIFAGGKWIRLTKDGPVSADIVPRDAQIVGTPSIYDLDGDGKAEVLLASADSRVWVFETDREIQPQWLQWQTVSGSSRHGGAWVDPRKMTPAIAKWARGRFSPND